MDMVRFLLTILLAFFLSGCGGQLEFLTHTATTQQATIEWQQYSEAMELKSEKPIFVYFTLKNCSACDMMQDETLSESEVIHFINQNYIPVKVDEKQAAAIGKYDIQLFPSIVILSSLNHVKLKKFVGAMSSRKLIKLLKNAQKLDERVRSPTLK